MALSEGCFTLPQDGLPTFSLPDSLSKQKGQNTNRKAQDDKIRFWPVSANVSFALTGLFKNLFRIIYTLGETVFPKN